MALTDAQQAMLDLMSPDLRFILAERDVSDHLQFQIAEAGYRTMGLFVAMVDSKTELRGAFKDLFGLDPAEAGLTPDVIKERRINVARLTDCWDATSRRCDEASRVQAEQKASRLPVTISRSIHITLRRRFETDHGKVQDRSWPCQQLIERRYEEVEEGDLKPDMLTEVCSLEEVQEEVIGAVLDRDGAIRMKRAAKTVPMPASSEQLRQRIKILATTFVLAGYKHSNRPWLRTSTLEVWRNHVDYILSDEIYGFEITTPSGTKVQAPWSIVLSYEYQVRKRACRLIMMDGLGFQDAMESARRCTVTKEQFFSTPIALSAAVEKRKRPDEVDQRARGRGRGQGGKGAAAKQKGGSTVKGGNGRGKGGKDGKKGTRSQTPDGRKICYGFQAKNCTRGANCPFVHICSGCLGDHPFSECPTPSTI